MHKLKELWMKFSIKNKWLSVAFVFVTFMLISQWMVVYFGISGLNEFKGVMESNSVYTELLGTIKEEQETFIAYMRNRTDESRIAYEEASERCLRCIESLPFDYEELGEARYARTWNVISGYDGYVKYRDNVIQLEESDPEYIDSMYEVLEMQESLSYYASMLIKVTLEQWDEVYEEKMQDLHLIYAIIVIVTMLILCLVIMFWKIITRSIIRPILLMADDTRNLASSSFSTPPLLVENQDELGELVHAYNKMKEAMKDYIHTLEEKNRISELLHKEAMEKMELETRFEQAQLEVLRQQINPHFLFNTLNMISSMAKIEDAETTDRMILSLSNLFRYALHASEQEVYLEEELAVLDDYIYLQKMRFANRIQYHKDIQVDPRKVTIPSFSLQPIVENAFIHGISSLEAGGKISIGIWEEKGSVHIAISDNGKGMDQDTLEQLKIKLKTNHTSRRGIGLGNICRRIHILYEKGSFDIESKKDHGTTVHFTIPQ